MRDPDRPHRGGESERGASGLEPRRSRRTLGAFLLTIIAAVAVAVAVTRAPGPRNHVPGGQSGVPEAPSPALVGTPLASSVPPATTAPPPPSFVEPAQIGPTVQALRSAIDAIIDGARWSSAQWSVLAVSLDRGDILYARQPDLTLAPASNVKVVTSAAALHYLGRDYRYPTYVLADGPIEDGILHGDLILYGTGDPALSDRFFRSDTQIFEDLTAQLRDLGVLAIRGDLVGDGSYFTGPTTEATWDPDDVNEWYAAPVTGLSYNENMVALRMEAAAWVGAPPRVQTLPSGSRIPIDNAARTVEFPPESFQRLAVIRLAHSEPIQVVGEIALGSAEVWREMTVSDPPLFAATMFQRVLADGGIEIMGAVRSVQTPDGSVLPTRATWAPALGGGSSPRVLAQHHSPALSELLEVVNNESHNLFAEVVFRSLGATVVGDASFRGGASATQRFLAETVGASADSVVLKDGSGLSAENRISARVFVELLGGMVRSGIAEDFRQTLPEAGRRGELPRMYRSSAAGNLRAKTGTIDRVSSLTGLVRSASGERIAFSIIANGVPSTWRAKRLEDRIGIELADFTRP